MKQIKNITMLLLATIVLTFNACSSDDDDSSNSNSEFFRCETYSLDFSSEQETQSATIETNANFNITKSDSWLSVTNIPNSNGKQTINVKVSKNDSGKWRQGFIYFMSKYDSQLWAITINQEIGYKIDIRANDFYFHIDPKVYKVKVQTTVNINDIDVIKSDDWFYATLNRYDTTLYVIAQGNCEYIDDKVSTIICKQKNGTIADTLIVKQAGFAAFEKEQLIRLYQNTGGDNWINKTNWGSDKPLNEWYGIKTNDKGAIEEIDLSNNNLVGNFVYKCSYGMNTIKCINNKLTQLNIESLPLSYKWNGSDGAAYSWNLGLGLKTVYCSKNNLSTIKVPDGVAVYSK